MIKQILLYLSLIAVLLLSFSVILCAQNNAEISDTSKLQSDTIKKQVNKKSFSLNGKIVYFSKDSVRFNVREQKVYLYGNADIKYEDLHLTAGYIEIDFDKNQLFAKAFPDSTGALKGKPVFMQGSESFTSSNLYYNFKSKKGLIADIITKEGEGYLHGNTVKKFPDNHINIRNGQYTTCDLEHPHFEIKFAKAKVIPNDKIVTGPAYLVIEDVPMPLGVPFGFFPNKKGQKNGILIPTYGESSNRGFFLENGGYYIGLGSKMDLALRGDIYSRGSWAIKASSNYNVRYKMNGNIRINYATNITGEKGVSGYEKNKSFFINWSHNQDAKARPNSRFSANVNAGTSNYNKYNPSSMSDYLSSTFTSSVSYYTTIASTFNFSANLRHSQNTLSHRINMSLPEIALSSNRIYPFRNANRVGKSRWYNDINFSYSMNARNTIDGIDTLMFKDINKTLLDMQNGMQHTIPISSSITILKNFKLTNSVNYSERWYLKTIDKYWFNTVTSGGKDTAYVRTDTIQGFKTARDFSLSSSLSTRIYGMYQFNDFKIIAIRHVLTPSVYFSYTPDFGNSRWGYYKYYLPSPSQNPVMYSIFQNGIYGSPPSQKSGRVGFSLSNNLEMKVRSKKDTITGIKKVVLIDNLTMSASYDLARDSLNWSKVLFSGRTKLFKNLDLRYAGTWDPYIINEKGVNLNQFEWKVNRRLLRRTNTDLAFSFDWNLRSGKEKKSKTSNKATPEEMDMLNANRNAYIDYEIPWTLNIYYTFQFTNAYSSVSDKFESKTVQTLTFNGDLSLTKRWKISVTSGYDFQSKKFSTTSVNIYRDLHCWEMVFNWIPIGFRKSYNMTIRVRSSVLQDLKLTKKKDFRDF